MPSKNKPIRRGHAVSFTLDHDAVALLHAMQANSNAYGVLVSELIRKEARERAERATLLASLAAMQDGTHA